MKINLQSMMNSISNFNNKGTKNFLPGVKFGSGKGKHPIPIKWLASVEEELENFFGEDTEEEPPREEPAASPDPVKTRKEKSLSPVKTVLPVKTEKPAAVSREEKFQRAVVWAEILGEPVSKKRKRKRWEQRYGNQGYADRR